VSPLVFPFLSVLLTDDNFPIGLSLVEVLLSKHASSDVAIFAAVRDPAKVDALIELQKKYPKKLFLVTYDAEDKESAKKAAKEVESRFGWVDIVIANAGERVILSFVCMSIFAEDTKL
jgi:NAD(P)-dependent dehydrogenase (short-subunit alcohol dehydrogenase family)